jgi:small subunit ribosomal protein S16
MVRIRLRRTGLRHQSSYRVMVADKESPRDGRFLENLGSYNPRTNPFEFAVNEGRIYHWLSVGAQPTESVGKLLKSVGILERFERFKNGEPVEALLAESKSYFEKRAAK